MTQISGDSGAADLLEAGFDGTAGSVEPLGILRQGTAQAATATTVQLDAPAAFGDSVPVGMTLVACGSTQGYCQSRTVTGYVASTDTATVDTWTVTPSGTVTYKLHGTAPSTGSGGGLDAAGVRAAVGLASANLDTQLSGIQADADNIQTRIPTALVSGRMDASVGAMASNVLTAAAINADAFTAAKFATDVTTELQTGLATAAALTTLSNNVGTPSNLGGGATIAANLSDIEAQTDDIGAAGAGLTAADDAIMARVGAPVGASISADVAAVKTDTAAILDDTGTSGVVVATASKTGYSLSAAGVDAIWDEPQSGHVTAGTFGVYLDSAVSGVSTGGVSASDIADAVWDEQLSGHVAAGSSGDALADAAAGGGGGGLDAAGVRAAIGLASANLDTQLSSLSTAVANVESGITWNPAWDAEVQSEVTDALNSTTLTEPTGKPAWGSSSVNEWLAWMAAWTRNQIQQTSSQKILRNDANNANLATCAVSDDGTTLTVAECAP
jgi:hypothetical protein